MLRDPKQFRQKSFPWGTEAESSGDCIPALPGNWNYTEPQSFPQDLETVQGQNVVVKDGNFFILSSSSWILMYEIQAQYWLCSLCCLFTMLGFFGDCGELPSLTCSTAVMVQFLIGNAPVKVHTRPYPKSIAWILLDSKYQRKREKKQEKERGKRWGGQRQIKGNITMLQIPLMSWIFSSWSWWWGCPEKQGNQRINICSGQVGMPRYLPQSGTVGHCPLQQTLGLLHHVVSHAALWCKASGVSLGSTLGFFMDCGTPMWMSCGCCWGFGGFTAGLV